jgi:hypothetical protein
MSPVNNMDNNGALRKLSDPGGGVFLEPLNFAEMSKTRKISAPSCQALKTAVSTLYCMDDFHMTKIGAGFFSEVYKVRLRNVLPNWKNPESHSSTLFFFIINKTTGIFSNFALISAFDNFS